MHVGRHTDRFRIIAYVIFGMLDFFGYRRPQRLFQSVVIDFLQPVTDHDAGNTVADHVGDGTRLRHEAVDTENQSKTGHRHVAHGRERGRQHNKARPRHAGCALTREQQHGQKCELLHKRHLYVTGLRNEDRSHRQINRRAVQVKGVTRRNHQTNH